MLCRTDGWPIRPAHNLDGRCSERCMCVRNGALPSILLLCIDHRYSNLHVMHTALDAEPGSLDSQACL